MLMKDIIPIPAYQVRSLGGQYCLANVNINSNMPSACNILKLEIFLLFLTLVLNQFVVRSSLQSTSPVCSHPHHAGQLATNTERTTTNDIAMEGMDSVPFPAELLVYVHRRVKKAIVGLLTTVGAAEVRSSTILPTVIPTSAREQRELDASVFV